jgi:hypothetical protein
MRLFIQLLFTGFVSIFLMSSCQNQFVQEINASIKAKPIANAGASSIIRLPINKDTLRGTASSVNGAIVSYLWSVVSGPNTPTIVSSNASTTIINNLIAGNYIFQFSVIDSDGYMGSDTVSVTVLPALQQTLVLQPTNNPAEVNFLFSPGLSINAPITELNALSYANGGTVIKSRAAFKFDLSSIPTFANLISAKLSLYSSSSNFSIPNGPPPAPNSGSNNGFWIQRITSNWNNNTTWILQPSIDSATQVSIPHTNLSALDLGDINVKQLVDSMRVNGNYGVIISLQNEANNNVRSFASSKHLDAGKHPKLVLVFQ